jgi:meso-butanediol dehydrogenase / (S,S)-butanediol dehydrogenase / diacetyl reductase
MYPHSKFQQPRSIGCGHVPMASCSDEQVLTMTDLSADAPVAIITGAGSGIGRAAAELFLARGGAVVAVDLTEESLRWTDGVARAISLPGDVTLESTNAAAVAAALEHFGRLDAAVLNAGMAGGLQVEQDGAMERFDQILAVNVRAVALGIRHAAPAMRATSRRGAVVATASTSGLGGDPRNWAYNTSKAAVINLVRGMAMDYGSQGIRVNAVAPGPVETGMTQRLTTMPQLHASMARRIPLQRWGQPSELAEAIWFLASPAASFVHGVVLPVDGGLSANAGHFDLPESAISTAPNP